MESIITSIINLAKSFDIVIYLVGGSIRDILLNKNNMDLDFVINQDPRAFTEKVASEIGGTFIQLNEIHKTCRIVMQSDYILDFSKMKGDKIEEDLYNRDFTINAMAYDIQNEWPLIVEKIIDPYNGKLDMKNRNIKHLHEGTFKDDPIRMLRAVRFMAQLEYDIDDTTKALIDVNASAIKAIAGERITNELFKILEVSKSYFYLSYMDKYLHLLNKIFPELEEMKEIGECKYHVVDSWTHSIYTVKVVESFIYAKGYFEDHIREAYEKHSAEVIAADRTRLQLIKLGALFHDVGKPSAKKIDANGRVRFRGHEITGAEIIKKYAEELRLSTKEKDILTKYVSLHMLPLVSYKNNDVSSKALYEMFNKMGRETLDILLIALADIIATRKLLNPHEEMAIFKVHIEYIANNYLTRYRTVEDISNIITGNDIIKSLQLQEGVIIGEIMEDIKKAIFFGKIAPTKEAAINYIKEIKNKQKI
ncbi:CCA tRNA nucleotidyltransferase [Alkaliphilus peptidifermentans]|uniref:Poly(A) polymerase n=1 Tax=Alkaliphilus peptidifermentans DSM 18978 TaxID=1120976 RepID=A0A1G5ANP3_9FIRM|nr:HDIG domain-containing metalloprotein [Alkaliphilus peptidifermentans]SCX79501.1 poly(A) polymerase [Alkaliphilus peptidifermentans DSM 18978]